MSLSAQQLPVVRATSTAVDIRDGNNYRKGYWTILPAVKPDVYYAQRGKNQKQIVFYTNVDSISFDVKPGDQHDFIILLNGKDSCYTRISTLRQSYTKDCNGCAITRDTIPFIIGKDNKIHITGTINGSKPLDFMFDTGADQLVLFKSGLKKVNLKFDGTMENAGFGGTNTRKTSNQNNLTINKLNWKNESVMYIDIKGDGDGIVGYNTFEDKVVEFDQDKKIMIIHSTLPVIDSAYTKLDIRYRGTLPEIEVTLINGKRSYNEYVVIDTGAGGTLFLNQDAASNKELQQSLKILSTGYGGGVGGQRVKSYHVILPELKLGGSSLLQLPMSIETISSKKLAIGSLLGMDVLKRFNMIIDYQNHQVYLKNNSLLNEPYQKGNNPLILIVSVAIGALVILFLIYRFRTRLISKRNIANLQSEEL